MMVHPDACQWGPGQERKLEVKKVLFSHRVRDVLGEGEVWSPRLNLSQFYCLTYLFYINNFQIYPLAQTFPELRTHITNCLLNASTWMSKVYLKVNLLTSKLCLQNLLLLLSSFSAHGSSNLLVP